MQQDKREKILVPKYVQYVLLPFGVLSGLWFISSVRTIIVMFLLAAVLAFVLDIPVSFLQDKLHFPRFIATFLVWLVIIGIFIGVLVLFIIPRVISELNNFLDQLPGYSDRVQSFAEDVQRWFRDLNVPFKPDITAQDVSSKLESVGESAANQGIGIATALVNIGFNFLLVLVISIYMLIDARRIKAAVKNAFPEKFRGDATNLFRRIQRSLTTYLRGQFIISSLMGIFGGLIAWYGGGGYAFVIGVWVALVEVIPFIGPFLGMTPAVILAWFAGGPLNALIVGLLFISVEQLEGQILVPRIMGKSVGVHPLWVIFAVLSGAAFGGIVGGLMAVPTVAVIKAIVVFCREELVLEKWDRPLLEKTIEEGDSP